MVVTLTIHRTFNIMNVVGLNLIQRPDSFAWGIHGGCHASRQVSGTLISRSKKRILNLRI